MDLERIYRYRFRDVDPEQRRRVWAVVAVDLHRRLGDPERFLDPAAGFGELVAGSPAPERWAVDLIDYGITALPGVRAQVAPLLEADLPADHFDAVVVANLLEHLRDPEEVATVLDRLAAVLRPGGRLAVLGPNFRYAFREYFDCADHVLPLDEAAVAEHLVGVRLEVEEVVGRYLPYSFRSRLPASPTLTRWYLRCPPARRLLGKQFLVVGRRPAVAADPAGDPTAR